MKTTYRKNNSNVEVDKVIIIKWEYTVMESKHMLSGKKDLISTMKLWSIIYSKSWITKKLTRTRMNLILCGSQDNKLRLRIDSVHQKLHKY